MNNEVETSPTTIGIFRVPRYKSEAGNKALEIFTKLKQIEARHRAASGSGQVTPLREIEPNLEELRYSAMLPYRASREFVKGENSFKVA